LKLGPLPRIDLAYEIKIQNAVRDLIREGLVKSAHDCSEGGLAVALAECCFNPEKLFGAEVDLKTGGTPAAIALFNESQSRIVISVAPENLKKTMSVLQEQQIPFQSLGKVGGNQLRIRVGSEEFSWPVGDLHDDWWNAIRRAVESDSAAEGIPSL
jgi:phosphoribosylformylglycinamidine synthase subunit PurL